MNKTSSLDSVRPQTFRCSPARHDHPISGYPNMSNSKRSDKPYGGRTPYAEALTQLNTDATPTASSTIKLDDIQLPQQQPRRYFDPQGLKEFVSSIRQHGILQPLLVRPIKSGGYELVTGERRYRAARELGLEEVPALVRKLNEEQAFQFALIENLQREDLNPIEETEGILQLLASRLECDSSAVKSLLYRIKNALDKEEKQSKERVRSRKNVLLTQAPLSH